MSKLIMVEGAPIKFQIWDTAGQEKYHSLAPMYYKGAAAAIVVYDITKRNTFKVSARARPRTCTLGTRSPRAPGAAAAAAAAAAAQPPPTAHHGRRCRTG
mmetsp:Transcript_42447/g.113257  ORF Transcript_42447/g.113257 Transcript_42447/m.113257 type:complete len:100 (-) Transcript_42447:200-499(-)